MTSFSLVAERYNRLKHRARPLSVILCGVVFIGMVATMTSVSRELHGHGERSSEEHKVQLREALNLLDPFNIEFRTTPSPPEKMKHVAFLKVHKTGSSTAQNIFLRFGWVHGLTFVLPPAKNKNGYPNIISLSESLTKNNTLPPPKGKQFDILCNHVFYNRKAFQRYLPSDTFYVGILREPFEMFKSTLNYMKPAYIFKRINATYPASIYLRNPEQYEHGKGLSWTKNRMAIEYGFPTNVVVENNLTAAMAYIMKLDSEFDMVLITELMTESIVMMKRLMHWSTKDILYLDKNVAKRKNDTKLVRPLDRRLYKNLSKVDYLLYNHFYRRLREQIRAEGSDFDDELLSFLEVRKMASEFCNGLKSLEKEAVLRVQESKWSDSFSLNDEDCRLLLLGEQPFIREIRFNQYGSEKV